MNKMTIYKKIFYLLALLALFGTMTNFVYFSPFLTLLLPLVIFVFTKEKLPRPIIWLFFFTALFLLSAVLYDPTSIFSFGFYRRDGNFIISYAPLLVLPLFRFEADFKKHLRYFFITVLVIYTALFAKHFMELGFTRDIQKIVFGGLFYAQNAVGGFLAIMAGLGFAYAWHGRERRDWIYFAVFLVILFSTYSRGSILGLILGIGAWFLAIKRYYKSLILYLMVPVLFTAGALMIGYPYYKNKIRSANYVQENTGQQEGETIKESNVIIRVLYTFPRAWYSFLKSPIVGTGVGSFDDRPYKFEPVLPLVQYNAQARIQHTDSHAHHSYLMFLAEQGVVGLGLFLTFWTSLFLYLMRMDERPLLRDFLLIAFFTITIESFTEHRITTPSNMLPFTISLGLIMACPPSYKTYVIKKVLPE